MALRLTGLALQKKGNLKAKPLPDEASALREALKIWEEALPFFGQKPTWTWEGTDPAIAAALFKGMAQDLLSEHGPLAVVKACQHLAGSVAVLSPPHAQLSASFPASFSSILMSVSFVIPSESMTNDIEGTAFSSNEVSLGELKEDLAAALSEEQEQPRFILDPLTMLPDQQFLALAKDLEKLFPNDAFAHLFGAAAVLLAWKSSEQIHAEEFAVAIEGLTTDGNPVHPGLEARIEAKVRLMDVALQGPTTDEQPVAFSVKRPRLS